eukprot:CAMPEP_0179341740 /NCGR_PEP_ID=MMETSP0797-20121207/70013_1 /TAXON_ID=47934 /ORGANISM="Dinophysis acuminata, Strain DAEP01" /LENGTH=74 /DNA_ID=CAMNT_0021055865 /DNA_START=96 /DNA_END=316 /DNA_ORIENTATION=-
MTRAYMRRRLYVRIQGTRCRRTPPHGPARTRAGRGLNLVDLPGRGRDGPEVDAHERRRDGRADLGPREDRGAAR